MDNHDADPKDRKRRRRKGAGLRVPSDNVPRRGSRTTGEVMPVMGVDGLADGVPAVREPDVQLAASLVSAMGVDNRGPTPDPAPLESEDSEGIDITLDNWDGDEPSEAAGNGLDEQSSQEQEPSSALPTSEVRPVPLSRARTEPPPLPPVGAVADTISSITTAVDGAGRRSTTEPEPEDAHPVPFTPGADTGDDRGAGSATAEVEKKTSDELARERPRSAADAEKGNASEHPAERDPEKEPDREQGSLIPAAPLPQTVGVGHAGAADGAQPGSGPLSSLLDELDNEADDEAELATADLDYDLGPADASGAGWSNNAQPGFGPTAPRPVESRFAAAATGELPLATSASSGTVSTGTASPGTELAAPAQAAVPEPAWSNDGGRSAPAAPVDCGANPPGPAAAGDLAVSAGTDPAAPRQVPHSTASEPAPPLSPPERSADLPTEPVHPPAQPEGERAQAPAVRRLAQAHVHGATIVPGDPADSGEVLTDDVLEELEDVGPEPAATPSLVDIQDSPGEPADAAAAPPAERAPLIAARGETVLEPVEELEPTEMLEVQGETQEPTRPSVYTPSKPIPPPAPSVPAKPSAAPQPVAAAPSKPLAVPPPKPPPAPVAPAKAAPAKAAPAKRKGKTKPWFEEIFDEDYLRTLPYLTPQATQKQALFVLESLGVAPGSQLLDVGCGYGRHAMELAARGHHVVGLDSSLPLLIRGADEAQRRGLTINFVHGDMREITFENQFDGAYCLFSTFGYFDDETNKKTAQNIARALKPGARFVVEVLNRDYVVTDLPSRVWWEGDGCVVLEEVDFNYYSSRIVSRRSVVFDDGRQLEQEISMRGYSLHELGKLLHAAGFRVLEISGSMDTRGRFFGPQSREIVVVAERPLRKDGDAKAANGGNGGEAAGTRPPTSEIAADATQDRNR
jgi:SAM-dependent methyltransferase